jgi:hypothetical protein
MSNTITRQKFWEKIGVKFNTSKCIPFSLYGNHGEEYDAWQATYMGKYIAGGGKQLDSLVEWLDKKQDKYLAEIKRIDSKIKHELNMALAKEEERTHR